MGKNLTWSELIDLRKKKNRNPKIIQWEDKISAKKIAAEAGCLVPKTYQITTDPKRLNFNKFPKDYVIKANHLAGCKSVFLISNDINLFTRKPVSKEEIIKTEEIALKKKISLKKNEWATTKIKPKIIVEELLDKNQILNDFKCYTFHGKVHLVKVDYFRKTAKAYTDYFDSRCNLIDWDPICLRDNRKYREIPEPKREKWDEMIKTAEKLGKLFQEEGLGDFIRIDLYITDKVYFGEFTLYPGSGAQTQFTKWVDKYLGLVWKYPEISFYPRFPKKIEVLNIKKKINK